MYGQVRALSADFAAKAAIPSHVVTQLNNFPSTMHPMAQFSAAIVAMSTESKFAQAYQVCCGFREWFLYVRANLLLEDCE